MRFNATIAGRPDFMGGRTSLTLYPGMIGMKENAFIDVKNRSSSITADLEIPPSGASGVILAQGGAHSGWSLYVKDGKPKFAYNFLGTVTTIASSERLPAGPVTVTYDFAYDGGKPGRGRHRDALDQREEGRLRQDRAHHSVHLRNRDRRRGHGPLHGGNEDYAKGDNSFTGTIKKVEVTVGPTGQPAPPPSSPED